MFNQTDGKCNIPIDQSPHTQLLIGSTLKINHRPHEFRAHSYPMEDWGKTGKGIPVKRVTLRPKLSEKLSTGSDAEAWNKVRAVIINYGAAIQQLWVPGFTDTGGRKKNGLSTADVVLGYPDVASYEKNPVYHGVIVGRVAGRISNAKFTIPIELDPSISTAYKLSKNQQKKHCLHGGTYVL